MALPIDLLLGSITFFHLCERHSEKIEKKNYNRFLAHRLVFLFLSSLLSPPNVISYFEKIIENKFSKGIKPKYANCNES